jgi:hypothetical protein
MKTKKEIVEEIEVNEKAKDSFVRAYMESRIDKKTLEHKLNEFEIRISTLNWVLDEGN